MGITLAIRIVLGRLSKGGVEVARKSSVPVSFDVNYRRKLWRNADDAVRAFMDILRFVDILFLDENEADLLLGVSNPVDVFRELSSRFGIGRGSS